MKTYIIKFAATLWVLAFLSAPANATDNPLLGPILITNVADNPFGMTSWPPLPPPVVNVADNPFEMTELSKDGSSTIFACLFCCCPGGSCCNDEENPQKK